MDRRRFGGGLAGLDQAKSFVGVNALTIPCYSLRVVLPNICREGL